LTGRRLANTGLDDIPEIDLFHNSWVNFRLLKRVLQSNNTKLRSGEGLESAIQGAYRGTRRRNDDNFTRRLWSERQEKAKEKIRRD